MPEPLAAPAHFVALDVHKQYVMVAAVDGERRVVLPPRRVTFDRFDGWIDQHLRPSDAVVLEATTNAWHLVDQLRPRVAAVTVAHPLKVGEIAAAAVSLASDEADFMHGATLAVDGGRVAA
jgi:hypothetical protein